MKKFVLTLALVSSSTLAMANSDLVETIKSINPHLKKVAPLETSIDPQTDLYRKIEDLTKLPTISAQDLIKLSEQDNTRCSLTAGNTPISNITPLFEAEKLAIAEIEKTKSWPQALRMASMWAQLRTCETPIYVNSISASLLNHTLENALAKLDKKARTPQDDANLSELKKKVAAFNPSEQLSASTRISIAVLASLTRVDIKNGALLLDNMGEEAQTDYKIFPNAVMDKKEIPFIWDKIAPAIAKLIDITEEAPASNWQALMDKTTNPTLEKYYVHMNFKKYGLKKAQDLMDIKKMTQLNKKISAQPGAAEELRSLYASFADKDLLFLKGFVALHLTEFANQEAKLKKAQSKALKILNSL